MIASLAGALPGLAKRGGAWRLPVPLGAAVISALVAYTAVANLVFLANANQFAADTVTALFAPPETPDDAIAIAAITEETLSQFVYRAPVDRKFVAELLTALAEKKPRAVGIDLLFDQPTEPEKDAALKHVLDSYEIPLFAAYTEADNVVSNEQIAFLESFVPKEKRALVTLAADQFDVARWVFPGAAVRDGTYVKGLSRALADAAGADTQDGAPPIAWRAGPGNGEKPFRQFPAHAVKVLPAKWFKDKIVLIGTDLTLTDRHRTPYTTIYSGSEGMLPGVVIQAHSLSQLLHGRSSPAPSMMLELGLALAMGLAGAFLGMSQRSIAIRAGGGLLLAGAFAGGCILLFRAGGPQAGPIAPNLALAMSFFAMEAISGSEARAQRELIKGVFSHHVAPEVVDRILNDPAKMESLEGERRFMTFLFTDVADFTTMSENVESRDLARILNAYLEGMTEIVQLHGGMVDKFIGDAVFAIFNAPIDLKDHAAAAIRCALDMDRFSEGFSGEQNAKGIPFGRTRLGIHSGTAVIGNFGSRKRHNYTASGDAVNTAARLEGLNKHFGTRMGVSGQTRALCAGMRFRPTASVVLKGKTVAIEVFEPLAEDGLPEDYVSRYRQAYERLTQGGDDAKSLFEALSREKPDDKLVAFHLERIAEGERGTVIVMTEK